MSRDKKAKDLIFTPYGRKTPELLTRAMDCLAACEEVEISTGFTAAELLQQREDLLVALEDARKTLEIACRYFPKSIRNADRFSLMNTLENSVIKTLRRCLQKGKNGE